MVLVKKQKKLSNIGVSSFSDLQNIKLGKACEIFGKHGQNLYDLCRGKDSRPVEIIESVKV